MSPENSDLEVDSGYRNELSYIQSCYSHSYIVLCTISFRSGTGIPMSLLGRLYNNIGDKFRWVADGELFLTGYRAGDFNLNGEITKIIRLEKGKGIMAYYRSMLNRQPSFWYDQWGRK